MGGLSQVYGQFHSLYMNLARKYQKYIFICVRKFGDQPRLAKDRHTYRGFLYLGGCGEVMLLPRCSRQSSCEVFPNVAHISAIPALLLSQIRFITGGHSAQQMIFLLIECHRVRRNDYKT